MIHSVSLFPFCIFKLSVLLPFVCACVCVVGNFGIFVYQRGVPVFNLLVHVETKCKLLGIPSQWSHMGIHLILPAKMYGNTCTVLPTKEVHMSLGPRFILEVM